MFSSRVGKEQNRYKRKVTIGFTFIEYIQTKLQMNANVSSECINKQMSAYVNAMSTLKDDYMPLL